MNLPTKRLSYSIKTRISSKWACDKELTLFVVVAAISPLKSSIWFKSKSSTVLSVLIMLSPVVTLRVVTEWYAFWQGLWYVFCTKNHQLFSYRAVSLLPLQYATLLPISCHFGSLDGIGTSCVLKMPNTFCDKTLNISHNYGRPTKTFWFWTWQRVL